MESKPDKIKLLIVDDEEDTREYVKSHFKRRGYLTLTAGSAEDALPIIKDEDPDIMLLDFNLPGMNGIELLRLVRQTNQTIRVILASGSDLILASDPRLKELNVTDVLQKPISFEVLEATLKKLIA